MKTSFAIGFWFLMITVSPCTVQQGFSQHPEDRAVDIYHGSLTNDVRRLLDEDYPAKEIKKYASLNEISISNMTGILNFFLKADFGRKEERHYSDKAINVIGRLRLDECLPDLEQIAHQSNQGRRYDAIQAITRIGGSNALTFAASILSDTNFSQSDRKYMYEDIMRHAISGNLEYDNILESSPEEKKQAMDFLIEEPCSSEKIETVLQHDEHVSKVQPSYRTNEARVVFLSYFCTNAPIKYRAQFAERINALRGSPFPNIETEVFQTGIEDKAISVIFSNATEKPTASNQKVLSASPALLPTEKPRHSYILWGICLTAICVILGVIIRIKKH